ncbi:unnamed protein product, partial [Ectocarpus sp. 4 AP-2014]
MTYCCSSSETTRCHRVLVACPQQAAVVVVTLLFKPLSLSCIATTLSFATHQQHHNSSVTALLYARWKRYCAPPTRLRSLHSRSNSCGANAELLACAGTLGYTAEQLPSCRVRILLKLTSSAG